MIRVLAFIVIYTLGIVFSYSQTKSEDIIVKNDSIILPGTLTYNENIKQPLIIFVPGSGNPDRNGNQPVYNIKPNYIKQLSNELTKNGIAFFRYDKRNVPKENIQHILKKYVFSDLVSDVSTIINHFKDDNRFSEIILIGHSQGSLVAMLAADKNVSKYISLAGLGESMDKTIIRQITSQSTDLGKIATQHLDELKNTGTIKKVNPFLVSLFAKRNHPFLLSYMKYDPTEEIKKVSIPILIINGTKDSQVLVKDAQALHKANTNSKLTIINGMNHVLKHIENDSDNLKSYTSSDFIISPELIKSIVTFAK
ncbi:MULTISPECIES: alpha/beta hydrolase family protein [unclassified Tenacibaculum]|uniref:alpha/beta hydrolase family protein n=1 Tax=unclassified Tenacibaculum TaxID=2635139 RepID=UPI001F3AA192|nr:MULTISPECIES: alpha/beta hydrolase [unclassified Tenacibaculum]MCF2876285.1 alpha/beta hydrolase [Tenacibaculum sp. Cn5-1]MCF2936360.1 alpha/beta hydrolase [Tenacibaculum sp. Cn5-34]MCG7511703.1 alpha/beta hydrolase [Tenacibaculum sp. Cn5-46]